MNVILQETAIFCNGLKMTSQKILLRYYNKAKSPVVLTRSELQLLGMAKPRELDIKILRDSDLVNSLGID
jgi:hypothetical protein